MNNIDWEQDHILYISNEFDDISDKLNLENNELRNKIEPWLTAVFQSEHLSLLLGTGLTTGICENASIKSQAMQRINFTIDNPKCPNLFKKNILDYADRSAEALSRGKANFEDDLRTAIELLKGLLIECDNDAELLEISINRNIKLLIKNLLQNEVLFNKAGDKGQSSFNILKKFLISFSSRTATRDRLHIFTTNYDRFIEYALDSAGIYTLDRFVGKINPIMRMNKMELDYHYNPPGIRGEPRYVEGVVRYTKLHGSLDWRIKNNEIYKFPLPFGQSINDSEFDNPYDTCVIYPNSSKGVETAYFPYSELFRDLSSAICRPNSVLVTYGYGFGDSHINNIITDMLTIPSSHLVIISYDNADGRIKSFVDKCNPSQLTILLGNHLGDIKILTENYLPKSAIDRISEREQRILEKRGENIDKRKFKKDKNEDEDISE
jgi:hypothetical protein